MGLEGDFLLYLGISYGPELERKGLYKLFVTYSTAIRRIFSPTFFVPYLFSLLASVD